MDEQNAERTNDMDELKTRLMKENAFLKSMASKPMSVYFDAYRTKAYDGGGEENLTFQVSPKFYPNRVTFKRVKNIAMRLRERMH